MEGDALRRAIVGSKLSLLAVVALSAVVASGPGAGSADAASASLVKDIDPAGGSGAYGFTSLGGRTAFF